MSLISQGFTLVMYNGLKQSVMGGKSLVFSLRAYKLPVHLVVVLKHRIFVRFLTSVIV